MESLCRVPCHCGTPQPLTYPGPWRHCQQQNWLQNMGAPIFLAGPRVPANVSHPCLDPYNRVQTGMFPLQAVSTQMNPNLSLRLCTAVTKEVGVQVSLRVHKSVQCSLGSRTLYSSSLSDRTSSRHPTEAWGVGRRDLIRRPQHGENSGNQKLTRPTEANQLLQSPWSRDRREKLPPLKELREEYAPSPQDRKNKQVRANGVHVGRLAFSWFLSAQPFTVSPPPISKSVSANYFYLFLGEEGGVPETCTLFAWSGCFSSFGKVGVEPNFKTSYQYSW